jgi:hypothetical protein
MTSADFCRFSLPFQVRLLGYFPAYQQISPGKSAIFLSIYLPYLLLVAFDNMGFIMVS